MNTEIYIVRHGQSTGNLEGRFMGHTDCGLSETGMRQAVNIKSFFEGIHIDAVISSDLKRAMDTALPTAQAHGLSIKAEAGFREIFAGEWEGMRFAEIAEKYPRQYGCWTGEFEKLQMPGGESSAQLSERVNSALLHTAEEFAGKTIVIATHATPIQLMRLKIYGMELEKARSFPLVANASVTKLNYCDGAFSIEYADCRDHLDEITLLQI